MKTDMVKHDVEVESSGECVDEIDKLTEVVAGSVRVFKNLVFVYFKLLQWHLVDVHIMRNRLVKPQVVLIVTTTLLFLYSDAYRIRHTACISNSCLLTPLLALAV
ncbi:hypothetical protein Tco_1017232 [Tanacetum coccineum]|uniref:Uncharacterized protein n=1 Tax=Tanacetum coccineum TaxID=301880 RepID=A0ABQ5FTG8_9ASTR